MRHLIAGADSNTMPEKLPILRIRIALGPNMIFGPGKADLLEHIAATGSISAAARNMRMSYKRAWQLVDDMNHFFRSALVTTAAGGARGGGAGLTPAGKRALACYRALQRHAQVAAKRELSTLERMLPRRSRTA